MLTPSLSNCFSRRRYEKGHWDAVIVKYKETELYDEATQLSITSRHILERMRQHLTEQGHVGRNNDGAEQGGLDFSWLPCHAIELHPQGELRAHVDSIRFSGGLVAGLSLGSASIMRLQHPRGDYAATAADDDDATETEPVKKDEDNADNDQKDGYVDLFLPPRSLYALTGRSRYKYTHELLPSGSTFVSSSTGESIVVPRDTNRWSIIFRDSKG